MRLLIGLAEVHYAMGAHEHALRAVEDGLQQAQATGSQKYVANAWALQGKILIALGGFPEELEKFLALGPLSSRLSERS